MRALGVFATVLSLCAGCGSCEPSDSRVPFGVDTGTPVEAPAPDREPPDPDFEPRVGEAFPAGTRRVAIEGAPIELMDADVRAVLAVDLDGDGDRDVLVVAADEGTATLRHLRRDGAQFGEPRELTRMQAPAEGCDVGTVAMRTVSPEYAVATLERSCTEGASQSVWIVSVEETPRLRESVTLLPPEGRAQGDVRVALRTADSDGDGHTDVLLDVSATPAGATDPATASIAWLDRPGGLARDTGEPEASIAALAQRAKQALGGNADDALAEATKALTLHAVLCREGGAPRVRFGDADGLACRASEGAGLAAAVATAALARRGDVFDALAARATLDGGAYRVPAGDRRQAEEALRAMARTEGVHVVEGPAAIAPAAPDVRLPLIGFSDEDTLIVRGVAPAVYRVSDEGVVPAEPAQRVEGDLVVVDPGGRFAVVGAQRTCEGHTLVVVRATEVVEGVVAGRPVSQPLVEERAPPPGSNCPGALPATAREDDGGWQVAGWAPQGVVAVRRDEVRLVPLTVDGQPAGEPTALEAGTPPPAPLPAGRMSPDGGAYVLTTPVGIVVRRVLDGETVVLRPETWSEEVTDVAVSPSGTRVGFVAGGKVQVATVPES